MTAPAPPEVVDVTSLLAGRPDGGHGVLWSASNQLQTNVISLASGQHIGAHSEAELDVTVAVVIGTLELRVGADPALEHATAVQAPAVVVLPAGTRRSLTAGPDGVTYLTAHRRRTGMLPTVR